MTRKKYIKLLMALDVPRNQATACANALQVAGGAYEEDYRRLAPFLRIKQAVLRTARNVTAAVTCLAESITRAMAASSVYKLDPADYEPEPAHDWPKKNPHLDGLTAAIFAVDEMDAHGLALTQEQIEATTAGGGGGHD